MIKQWMWIGLLASLVLLRGCKTISVEGVPEEQLVDVWATSNASTTQIAEDTVSTSTPAATPTSLSKWDDRSVYAQTLSASGQQYLDELPMASIYHISLAIPDDLSSLLTGELEVRYFNQENQPLDEVVFRLYPNYYGGLLVVQDVRVNSESAEIVLGSGDTALRVDLDNPLQPGQYVVISMGFQLELPKTMGGNYGLLGYFEDILVLDTFYPMIPLYDQDGWCAQFPHENGDLTCNDASFYQVEVEAPIGFELASSGSAVSVERVRGDQRIWNFAAGPARDFYLVGSERFAVYSKVFDGYEINSYAPLEYEENLIAAIDYAGQAIEIFSDLFGPYPYREFDVVSSPMLALGIEYPGITGIFLELYQEGGATRGLPNQVLLESVVVHEVAHQWFYNAVGNNQQRQPWVDESLVQYLTYIFYLQKYGEDAAQAIVNSWQQRLKGIENPSLPIGLSSGEYDRVQYSAIIYGKGPLFFKNLEEEIGREVLWESIASYYESHLWGVADTEDLRASLETGCGCDLGVMFEEWVYSGGE